MVPPQPFASRSAPACSTCTKVQFNVPLFPCAGWAIFTTLCCCVRGLAAIYYAVAAGRRASAAAATTTTDGSEQRRAEVRQLHRRAKCCVKAGVMAGVGLMLALALIYVCLLLVIIYTTASASKRGSRKPVQKISPR